MSIELPTDNSRYAWIDALEDEQLAKKLKALSAEDIELITLYAFEEHTQEEISKQFGISQRAVSKRIVKLRKFFKKFF